MYQDYKDKARKCSPLTMADIVRICRELVPDQFSDRPWCHPEVDHGRGILQTGSGLNCYMAAYGAAHHKKAIAALELLPSSTFSEPFEVFDWGCGQGVGTMCLVEHLRKLGQIHNLKKITLIEPSSVALSRAALNLRLADTNAKIVKINKGLPACSRLPFASVDEISVEQPMVLHLFSNILDITTIDLEALAELIASEGRKRMIVCVGPADCQESRIDTFCSYFDDKTITFSSMFREREFYFDETYGSGRWLGCYIRSLSFLSTYSKVYYDLDDALSVEEFFDANGVKEDDQTFILRNCIAADGSQFNAVGFANGEILDDGRPSYTFFVLSGKLENEGEILDTDFLMSHKSDIRLLEPLEGRKFGILFLARNKHWSDL